MHVLLDAVQTPQDANGADLALELGLIGNVAFPLADVFLLVVPLQMIHDLRDVLGGEWAEVALKGMHMSSVHYVFIIPDKDLSKSHVNKLCIRDII